MIIGFTGASATGKSWVAEQLATQLGFSYVPSKAAEVAEEIGFDVNAPHTFAERLNYQEAILQRMVDDISRSDTSVFDRAPTDLMTFMIRAEKDDLNSIEIEEYLESCLIISECFDVIFYVCPEDEELAGSGEFKPGRLSSSAHGSNHRILYNDCLALLTNHPLLKNKVVRIPSQLHYQDRVDFVKEFLNERSQN